MADEQETDVGTKQCEVCGGPLRRHARYGVCERSPACRAENRRRKYRADKAGLVQRQPARAGRGNFNYRGGGPTRCKRCGKPCGWKNPHRVKIWSGYCKSCSYTDPNRKPRRKRAGAGLKHEST